MQDFKNREFLNWITSEKDAEGYDILKKDTPEEIKKQYEQYKENNKKWKDRFFE